MAYKLGRLLQLAGLILLPVAIAGQASDSMSLGQMLTWACVGIALFMLGRMLQGKGE